MRYARRITGDVESARDVVQETFLRFCSDGAPRDDTLVAQWLYIVCRNRALDVRKKDRRMRCLSDQTTRTCPDAGPTPSERLERREAEGCLRHLVTELPENQQEAIRLRFQGGLSYRQIGEVMETSVGNVGFLIHTAIKTIRERMEAAPSVSAGRSGEPA